MVLPRSSILALLAGFALSASVHAAEPAALAPKDVLMYLGVTDADEVWERFKKTNDYKLFQDPALKEGMGDVSEVGKVIERFREKLATALDTKPDDLKNPFKGPLTLYLAGERGAKRPDVVFIGTIGDQALMEQYFQAATKKLKAAATDAQTVEAGSNQIHVFKNARAGETPDNANDNSAAAPEKDNVELDDAEDPWKQFEKSVDVLFSPESMPEEIALCKTSDKLLVANNESSAKRALTRERDSSLADNDDHKSMLRLLEQAGPIRFLVNIPRIVEQARTEAAEDEDLQKQMRAMGVDSMRCVVGHMQFAGEDYEQKLEAVLLMSGERSGLAKLLSFENRPIAPAATVDATNLLYASWNVNPPALLDEVERMMRQMDPEQADAMRQSLENAPLGEKPVNLRKDLIDNLAGPITFGLDLRPPYEPDEVRMLLTLGCRNKEPITRLLGMVPMFTQRDFRGTTIYTFPIPVPVANAVTSDRVLIGTAPAVETALGGESASQLAESPAFRKVSKHVPAEAWFTMFFDEQRATDALLAYRSKSEALDASTNAGAMLVGAMAETMVGSMKADSEAARKLRSYRGVSILTVSTTSDGVRITGVKVKGQGSQ